MSYTKDFYFLKNNLFTQYALRVDFVRDFPALKDDAQNAFSKISALYDTQKFANQNEHQFEDSFIAQVAQILGYHFIRQEEKIIQGKLEKPDFLLFTSLGDKKAYESIPKDSRKATNTHIALILESKAYNIPIDTGKIKDNPHFQILRYLSNLKLDFGFLANGKLWRFYDNSTLTSQKVFYQVDLESIIQKHDLEAFLYFYYIFRADRFAPKDLPKSTQDSQDSTLDLESKAKKSAPIYAILSRNDEAKITLEDDLQNIIYGINGEDSLFEFIGERIFKAQQNIDCHDCANAQSRNDSPNNPQDSLKEIYENSLYFIFRLLFIAYFEDKFSDILLSHKYFNAKISLNALHSRLKEQNSQNPNSPQESDSSFGGLVELSAIFRMYNKGEPNYDMPVFNGGLFDSETTRLLSLPRLFSDSDLAHILGKFFYYDDGHSLFKRDYKTLSVAHLGTIYEGLLGYFFALADEDLLYVKYATKADKQKEVETYIDRYDYAELQRQEKLKKLKIIGTPKLYTKGQIYLKNSSNSRKSTASFYTPQSITRFLVAQSLEQNLTNDNILHFKILDNACGSGHFLIESLNQITALVLENFEKFESLKSLYEQEKAEICANATRYIQGYEIDEGDILKRLLLKRIIFGVDLNPFSVELTKLSLWIDSFIFGTPLSFIEHHIKRGNALIGSTIAEFSAHYDTKDKGLFISHFLEDFSALAQVFAKLDSLKDTSESEVAQSKRIYRSEILPTLNKLNLYLNFFTAQKFATHSQRKTFSTLDSLENLVSDGEGDYKDAADFTRAKAKEFAFFNYEIEFPEIRNGKFNGFQAIVGNPPWDKIKFDDRDFFSQFKSDYRTLSPSKKAEFRANQLSKPYILKDYESQKTKAKETMQYYLSHFPLNRGEGELNLFRLFVERNLALLARNASLNYVLPSALMLEKGSYNLRKEILTNYTMSLFYAFENREGIFNDVDSRYKFALMQVSNATPPKNHSIKTMFYKTNIDEIYKRENIIKLNLAQIRALSPAHLALQEVRNKRDLAILNKCYKSYKLLNFDWLDFRTELNASDSDLFIESHKQGLLPLYQGEMIHQFNAEFSTPNYFLDKDAFDNRLKSKEIYRLKQDLGIDSKEYSKLLESIKPKKVSVGDFESTLIRFDKTYFRLGYRKVARDTDERTLIFTLIPKQCGCYESVWQHIPKRYILDSGQIRTSDISHPKICFALGIFNSLIVDFIARTMIQINVNKTYLERIPLPQPSDDEIKSNETYAFITRSALILQLCNDSVGHFVELANEFGIAKSEIPKTQKLYDSLKARLDIAVAKLYGLDFDDFSHILESFKVLHSKQPAYIALLKSLWN